MIQYDEIVMTRLSDDTGLLNCTDVHIGSHVAMQGAQLLACLISARECLRWDVKPDLQICLHRHQAAILMSFRLLPTRTAYKVTVSPDTMIVVQLCMQVLAPVLAH